jgi:hypothetical protein
MFVDDLDQLEAAILQKRLTLLLDKGVEGRPVFGLSEDFFALMKDKWAFDNVMSTLHGLQEIYGTSTEDAIGAVLEVKIESVVSGKKKRGRKKKIPDDISPVKFDF